MTYLTNSEADTLRFAGRLAPMLSPGDAVLLFGDLGAGKSVLARGIARALGVQGPMPSPTFTLLMPYATESGVPFYHFDLYRLADPEEYLAAGLDEYIGGNGIAAVEWPQMAELAPEPALEITLERVDGGDARRIEIENYGVAGFNPEALLEWAENP